jgi:hypothetical protein
MLTMMAGDFSTIQATPSFIPRGYPVVRVLLGLLLLTAAVLKYLGRDSQSATAWFYLLLVRIAVIEVEAFLGLWLLAGIYPRGAWLGAFGVFAILAGVSGYLGILQEPSCGCFGTIAVNPWITFAVDAVALGALWRWRPRPIVLWRPGETRAKQIYQGALYVVFAGVLTVAISFGLLHGFGNLPAAIKALAGGPPLQIEPGVVELGNGVPDETRDFEVKITNHGTSSAQVGSGTATCPCVTISDMDLPMTIPPGGAGTVHLTIKFVHHLGPFKKQLSFTTDNEIQSIVVGWIEANIVEHQ